MNEDKALVEQNESEVDEENVSEEKFKVFEQKKVCQLAFLDHHFHLLLGYVQGSRILRTRAIRGTGPCKGESGLSSALDEPPWRVHAYAH